MIIFALLTCSRDLKSSTNMQRFINECLAACEYTMQQHRIKVLKQVRKQFKTFNRNQSRR